MYPKSFKIIIYTNTNHYDVNKLNINYYKIFETSLETVILSTWKLVENLFHSN